jgi:8-amino-7-oxononanoate synthase
VTELRRLTDRSARPRANWKRAARRGRRPRGEDGPRHVGDGPALFEKCRQYTRVEEARASGIYPYFRSISDSADTVVTIEGREKVMLGSNNYLGLTHHPRVREAAEEALRRFGSGCTGSRFLNGTLDLHGQLEAELGAFLGKEDCLVFSTGYCANLGMIAGLVGRNDTVYLDKLDHASIVDGAQLSFGETVRFRHADVDDLRRKMSNGHAGDGKLIVVDGLYSMEGEIADIPALLAVARERGAALAVDEAHALGVLGPNGDGASAHHGVLDQVDVITGTFSKSLASIGGFVAGARSVVDYLRHHSRPLIFTASLPPASTAGVLAALAVMRGEPERRERLWRNTERLHEGFEKLGFDTGASTTPIVPVLIGTLEQTLLCWRRLFDAGVFTNPVIPPAVPADACRLRTSVMATHTFEQIDFCLEAFAEVGRDLGVI